MPTPDFLAVNYRVDGMLYKELRLLKAVSKPIVSSIKILSGMNIAERRLPQDGRIHGIMQNKSLDIRVSCIPAISGETLVMRIIPGERKIPELDELGLEPADLRKVQQLLNRAQGMVLVTGPTGSGKSTTLMSFLNAVFQANPRLHILSVEDPVELVERNITQVQIDHKVGMTFSRVLRNALRHDPDVIMVGEIRDEETALVAVQASLTGHLLLSTLHTTNAIGAISRLVNMGVKQYLVASALSLVLTQRLIRRLCTCAVSRPATVEERAGGCITQSPFWELL